MNFINLIPFHFLGKARQTPPVRRKASIPNRQQKLNGILLFLFKHINYR